MSEITLRALFLLCVICAIRCNDSLSRRDLCILFISGILPDPPALHLPVDTSFLVNWFVFELGLLYIAGNGKGAK